MNAELQGTDRCKKKKSEEAKKWYGGGLCASAHWIITEGMKSVSEGFRGGAAKSARSPAGTPSQFSRGTGAAKLPAEIAGLPCM